MKLTLTFAAFAFTVAAVANETSPLWNSATLCLWLLSLLNLTADCAHWELKK